MEKILKYVNHHFGSEAKVIKTDLALVDDAKKSVNALQKAVANFGDESREIISAQSRLAKKIENAKSDAKKAKQILEKYAKQLKDLGVDEEPNVLRNLKNEITKAEKSAIEFEKRYLR